MKKIILSLLLVLPSLAFAQTEETESFMKMPIEPTRWDIGVSTMQWNEELNLHKGALSDTDTANFNGLALYAQKEFNYESWGWNAGGFIGSGRAVGGGNSGKITYSSNKENFTMVGLTPRIYYFLTDRVNLGVSAFLFWRGVSWSTTSDGASADSDVTAKITALADVNIRLFQNWDLYQGIGPLSAGATLWKVGVNYRF